MEILGVSNLSFQRGSFSLSIENLSILNQERIAFLGLNGSGKSTLFQLIAGLHRYSGSIKICGEEIKSIKRNQLGMKVSLSFQNPDHNIITSKVKEELLFASKNYYPERTEQSVLDYVLEYFPIHHLLNKSTQELSYGEKRLVSLATSMAHRPDLILLDEPFTMLDYKQKNNLQDFIRKMPSKAILIASHETDLLEDLCEKVCILELGKLAKCGSKVLLVKGFQ